MQSVRTLLAVVLTIVGIGIAAPQQASAAPGAASRSQVRAPSASFDNEVLRLTNLARARHGVRPLAPIACSVRTANRWARVMATRNNFRHQSSRKLARACGTRYVGENIAMGRPLGAAQVVAMWMRSPGHRANILNPNYGHLGVGAYSSVRSGRTYVVQNFRR